MTVEEIIENLNKEKPLELNMADGVLMQIELTPSDEYVINYFHHHKIIDSKIFSHKEDFVLYIRELHDKRKF